LAEPVVVSNWKHGVTAIGVAAGTLGEGGTALDAVEKGICAVEDDPLADSVGTGGIPNFEGVLELDASVMVGNTHRSGGVTGLTMTKNPISVARKVMELSPHVMLSGEGARRFARAVGFPEYDPMTERTREKWSLLRSKLIDAMKSGGYSEYVELAGFDAYQTSLARGLEIMIRAGEIKNLGTVGTLCLDAKGMIVAGTSTSGLPLRLPGRVSDSSVIGAGTYASEDGAASATGIGEFVIRHNLTRKVCDYLGEGYGPTEACEESLRQMLRRERVEYVIGLIALDKKGRVGGATSGRDARMQFSYQFQRLSDRKMISMVPTSIGP
jgi:isoaspartyl peptidase/L-asparaginase-like protein (Ntn-hydrolase superfamily)